MGDRHRRSIIFVHAHPDDESVSTGATMAYYADRGARVTLVTCTLGEEGESHVPALAGLVASEADQLGGYRMGELDAACRELGVTDYRFLCGAGRYRDSGMMGWPSNDHPRAFWNADLDKAAKTLTGIIDEVRPQVVVTYDPHGLYGHPDHIQAHRVTTRAIEGAFSRGIGPMKVYWIAFPEEIISGGMGVLAASEGNPFAEITHAAQLPFVSPATDIAAAIDASAYGGRKVAAMRAHATQIPTSSWLLALASNCGETLMGVEYYRLAFGARGPGFGEYGWEDDLFAGIPGLS